MSSTRRNVGDRAEVQRIVAEADLDLAELGQYRAVGDEAARAAS